MTEKKKEDEKTAVASYLATRADRKDLMRPVIDLNNPDQRVADCSAELTKCMKLDSHWKACYAALDMHCSSMQTSCIILNRMWKLGAWADSKKGLELIKARGYFADRWNEERNREFTNRANLGMTR